jgi:hypothetical protein
MTCWPTEAGAVLNMIEHFGTGAFATVMDSYDYTAALNQILPGAPSGGGCDTCCVTRCDNYVICFGTC